MAKDGIHPKWYPEAKVYCNGEMVMTVGSTKPELNVDVWSGNHPYYTGTQKIIDTEGRVERFLRKYGMMDGGQMPPPVDPQASGPVVEAPKTETTPAKGGKGGKKKK